MRFTQKGHYAIRAVLDIAARGGDAVRLQEISTRQSISLHYLEQLFRKLRLGLVVKSVRGPGGGYVLSRQPKDISIRDIMNAVGENVNPAREILGIPSSGFEPIYDYNNDQINQMVDTQEFQRTKKYFDKLGKMMEDHLTLTTVSDLLIGMDKKAG